MAHQLEPIFQIGKEGVTDAFIDGLNKALTKREILKVHILETAMLDTRDTCNYVAERLGAEPVQAIGNKFIIYRKSDEEKYRKIGYSSLECLSLDPDMRDCIRPFLPELREAAETLPRLENEDAGLMARGILVNLGEMDIQDLYGPEAYKRGLKFNYGRRAMIPLPN